MHIFGKLKIAPGGAVPFRQRHVLEITRLEQAALGFEETAFGHTILKLRSQTAPEILLDRDRRLLGIIPSGTERLMALSDAGQVVVDA